MPHPEPSPDVPQRLLLRLLARLLVRVLSRIIRAAPFALVTLLLGACALPARTVASSSLPPAGGAAPALVTASPSRMDAVDAALDAAARAHPVAFLDRIGWGADAAELAQMQSVGASRFLDAQLHPQPPPGASPGLPPELPTGLPTEIAERIAALDINQPLEVLISPLVRERRAMRESARMSGTGDPAAAETTRKATAKSARALTEQAMDRQLLLALYSPDQLQQRLCWFWLNHFNVYRGVVVGPMMGDYLARVIEPHALGHFRDLLRATMFSPQMLVYLNNAQNARGHINENYAREVMELHTLGVGSGYTQADVANLARVLTGLGVDLADRPVWLRPALRADLWRSGLVVFNPARHDSEPEVVLGATLAGRGIGEIEQAITLLADHPATARHVSLELAKYFVSDDPPQAMVDAMVKTWGRSDGDIAAVLRTMFTSAQFAASLAEPQFKDPMRYVLSSVRVRDDAAVIATTRPLMAMLAHLGEPLYGRQTPDGYPTQATAWNGPGQLTARFDVARQLGARAAPREGPPALAQSAVYRTSAAQLGVDTRRSLAQARDRVTWNTLWLSSPEFMNF